MAFIEGWSDIAMRYGLWFGAIFQMICILAIIIYPSKKAHELEEHTSRDYSVEKGPQNVKVSSKHKLREKGTRKRR